MALGNGSDQDTMEFSIKYNPPIDLPAAERNLKEVKQILDRLRILFVLGSGTCLGAVRDTAIIPWDDDVDLVSVIGINGLGKESIDVALAAFKDRGYYVRQNYSVLDRPPHAISHSIMKDYARVDWTCSLIVDNAIYSYPGVHLPARLFTYPTEIEFLGGLFLVPDPPEEYLRLKYGVEWMVPKRAGEYEIDVVANIPDADLVGQPSWLRVLDHEGRPVPGAEVALVGGGRSRTDENGRAEVVLPGSRFFALVIRYPGHEQVLYMEELEPDRAYVYRAGSASDAASIAAGPVGTIGNVLLPE